MNKNILKISILVSLFSLNFSCIKVDGIEYNRKISKVNTEVNRDRMPWAFRINMDERVRNIILALNKELWLAYDAQKSGLYKAWVGGVNFDGIIYNNAHGLQPTSRGVPYLVDELKESPWSIHTENGSQKIDAEYNGYKLFGDKIKLQYKIILDNQEEVIISETPEYIESANMNPGLHREFTVVGLPNGYELSQNIKFENLIDVDNLHSNSKINIKSIKTNKDENGFKVDAEIFLKKNGSTILQSFFPKNLYVHETKNKGSEQKVVNSVYEELDGKALIGKLGCVACHYIDKGVLGPAYQDVANKYDNSDETKKYLVKKIQTGGKGVWGPRLMPPHPHIDDATGLKIVDFILSLDTFQDGEYLSGVAVDFYDVGQELPSMPKLLPGQNPSVSQVFPDLFFQSGNPDVGWEDQTTDDFLDFFRYFTMDIDAYLKIDEPGEYEFRFLADKGGSFKLNDEELGYIENLGYVDWGGGNPERFNEYFEYFKAESSPSLKSYGSKFLDKGYHKIDIEFYQGILTMAIVLQWRKKGDSKFEMIPESVLFHDPRDIKPTSAGLKEIYKTSPPGLGGSLISVHPSFDLLPARPDSFEPRVGGMDFLSNGDLAIATWDGEVFIVKNSMSGDPSKMSVKKIADGLCEPLGLAVANDEIYVQQRWELTKLIDLDGDEITDHYYPFSDDWEHSSGFHAWGFGLTYRDGFFYTNTGPQINYGNPKDAGKTLKISITDGTWKAIAHGYKAPNGIGFGYGGDLFTTDNEGGYVPTSKLMHLDLDNEEEYPFFGNAYAMGKDRASAKKVAKNYKIKPPVVWTPQNEIGNSPSEPGILNQGPYKNQMIMGDARHGGLKRVFIEEVNGQLQGALFRFTQGLEAGINRFVWGPDSSLYVGGVGGTNDFTWEGKRFGLEKLTYNGKTTFEMLSVKIKSNGFEIEFTEPIRLGDGISPSDYLVQQWWYDLDSEGGVKQDLQTLDIESLSISTDRKKVFLQINNLSQSDHKGFDVVYIKMVKPFFSESLQPLWTSEVWYTLNEIPSAVNSSKTLTYFREDNLLSKEEKKYGWNLIFDGDTFNGWKNFNNKKITNDWEIVNGMISNKSQNVSLVSENEYENFELEFDWKIDRATDAGFYINLTSEFLKNKNLPPGLEMQIIDDNSHPDAAESNTRVTGSLYDVIPSKLLISNPPGSINHSRIVSKNGQIQYWLNGLLVLEYETNGDFWNKAGVEHPYFSYNMNDSGYIGISAQEGKISFNNIRIRNLAEKELIGSLD